jgi:hypothetical protein
MVCACVQAEEAKNEGKEDFSDMVADHARKARETSFLRVLVLPLVRSFHQAFRRQRLGVFLGI